MRGPSTDTCVQAEEWGCLQVVGGPARGRQEATASWPRVWSTPTTLTSAAISPLAQAVSGAVSCQTLPTVGARLVCPHSSARSPPLPPGLYAVRGVPQQDWWALNVP